MRASLFKNLRLQTYIQVINSIIPLITTPYISRVLGADNVGIFSSYHAMASFFTLFAVFGMGSYGTRCIAAERNETKRKALFMELYSLQLITCCISAVGYLGYCLFLADNNTMAFLQFITLGGCFLDISWFYFGIEDFKFAVVTNTIFRIASVFCLLFWVNTCNDVYIYTIIMLGSAFMSQLVLWIGLIRKGYIKIRGIKKERIKEHIIPNFMLFVPMIAMTVCNSTDKAMLGALSSYDQAGFYANTDRIINVPYSLFLGIGTVFLPRMTSLSNENKSNAKSYFFDTLSGIIMLGVAISFGIISVARRFIPFFLGPGYEPCVLLVEVFSGVVIIKSISTAVRMHYLVPFKEEKIYIIATAVGAVLNLFLNFILIPQLGALGAVITTLISEFIVLVIQIIRVFRIADLKNSIIDLIVYIGIGLVMAFILRFLNIKAFNSDIEMIIDIFVGTIVYCLLTLIYWRLSKNRLYILYIKPRVDLLISKVKGRQNK